MQIIRIRLLKNIPVSVYSTYYLFIRLLIERLVCYHNFGNESIGIYLETQQKKFYEAKSNSHRNYGIYFF